ncbi:hypothetical protein [Ancylobacter sp. FA202]|uniref:hypothetical protein n=1 Tax=Ancylobacter sp. FA202 TaxID=1111106 RepID=UPI00037AF88B|nr:hypothetical protein [Ancylobacter sp. FA202]
MSGQTLAPSRRQALALGAALVAVPTGALTIPAPLSPQERIAAAVREIETALAEIYPGASLHPILQLPATDAFASPVLADGSFTPGQMAMVSVTANSFSARFAAGLTSHTATDWFGRRVA